MTRWIPLLLALTLFAMPSFAQSPDAELTLEHEAGVVTASWNADETRILTASQSGMARVWSAEDGESLLSISHEGSPLTHALWVGGGALLLSADESGLVIQSDADDGERVNEWRVDGMPIHLELNAAGTLAFVFTANGAGSILSLADGGVPVTVQRTGAVIGAGWSADESQLRAWSDDGEVVAWDSATGEELAVYSVPHRALLGGLAWSGDDSRVLAWFADGTVAVYATDGRGIDGRPLSRARHRSFVRQAIWSRGESLVMSWAGDDTVHVWRADDGGSELVLRHEDWVVGARWDAEELRQLSWSHIYVYLWRGGELLKRFRHDNLLRGAVWNGDGGKILSWSWDGTARLWSA